MHVSISNGNNKMGSIKSVSLPSIYTCRRDCTCQSKCYAHKLERLRPSVRKAYENNLGILLKDPELYWREVEGAIMMSRFFRFHVSGDIPYEDYFAKMVEVAARNPHCEILCFTKKYEIVNDYINKTYLDSIVGTTIQPQLYNMWMVAQQVIPKNLHIIFSGWVGLNMVNPFLFPTAEVRYKDGKCFAKFDAKECNGNCTECAVTGDGCWTLKSGEQIVFNEH